MVNVSIHVFKREIYIEVRFFDNESKQIILMSILLRISQEELLNIVMWIHECLIFTSISLSQSFQCFLIYQIFTEGKRNILMRSGYGLYISEICLLLWQYAK